MYFPYRHREFLSDNVQTYQQFFHQNSHIILPNMEPFENLTLELNEAWQRLQEGGEPEEAWADIAANQEVNRIEEEEELELIRNELLENTEEVDLIDMPDISVHMRTQAHQIQSQPLLFNGKRRTCYNGQSTQ